MTHEELERKFAEWVCRTTEMFAIKQIYDGLIEKRIVELEKKLEVKNG